MSGGSQSQTPYIGSRISLISKLDVRYEGILYTVDTRDSTISLAKVRSYGTEDRPTANPVPARDDVFEYIIFKASDIKDIIVNETPKAATHLSTGLPPDPAIVSVSGRSTLPSQTTPSLLGHSSTQLNQSVPFGAFHTAVGSPLLGGKNRGNGGFRLGPMNLGAPPRSPAARYGGGPFGSVRGNMSPLAASFAQRNGSSSFGGLSRARPSFFDTFDIASSQQQSTGMFRPNPRAADNIKFDSDFDFEKANQQFNEEIVKIEGTKAASVDGLDADAMNGGVGDSVSQEFYNKKTGFFDRISCEAIEKASGNPVKIDWKKARLTNQETFGLETIRQMVNAMNNRKMNASMAGGYGSFRRGVNQVRNQMPMQLMRPYHHRANRNANEDDLWL